MTINVNIYNENVLDFFNKYEGERFSFALYDPPYEMNIINNKWDNSGVVFSREYNEALFKIMKPGAFVLCYGHARVFHRVMVALEDAGFIVHKAIFGWGYSSGNPQGAANIQRNLDNYFADKHGGICTCENPVVSSKIVDGYFRADFEQLSVPINVCDTCGKPIRKILEQKQWNKNTGKKKLGGPGYGNDNIQLVTEPMTPESKILSPYTYGLASFKPQVEPIILVQKPFENSAVESIIKYGTGIVNVHQTRYIDRWPGNFIAIHELGCELVDGKWKCIDGCEIGEQIKSDPDFTDKYPTFAYNELDLALASIDPMVIESKPTKKEKNLKDGTESGHPTVKPIKLIQYLAKLFLPPSEFGTPNVFVPFSGSGSEMLGLITGGWEQITGVELSKDFSSFSVKRINEFVKKDKSVIYHAST